MKYGLFLYFIFQHKLECCNVRTRWVGHDLEGGREPSDECKMVCPARAALIGVKDTGLIETALVRETYAGWCGGTAVMSRFLPD
jgi:hypothetical protein